MGNAIVLNTLNGYDLPSSMEYMNGAFSTPGSTDSRPSITLFGFNGTTLHHDSSYSNEIITHEYGHGL
jgi:hypothetical protein